MEMSLKTVAILACLVQLVFAAFLFVRSIMIPWNTTAEMVSFALLIAIAALAIVALLKGTEREESTALLAHKALRNKLRKAGEE